eukprot:scaffold59474_cov18-Tisochrysis_lutea.AAC.1
MAWGACLVLVSIVERASNTRLMAWDACVGGHCRMPTVAMPDLVAISAPQRASESRLTLVGQSHGATYVMR